MTNCWKEGGGTKKRMLQTSCHALSCHCASNQTGSSPLNKRKNQRVINNMKISSRKQLRSARAPNGSQRFHRAFNILQCKQESSCFFSEKRPNAPGHSTGPLPQLQGAVPIIRSTALGERSQENQLKENYIKTHRQGGKEDNTCRFDCATFPL